MEVARRLDDYRRRQATIPGNIDVLDVFALSETALLQSVFGIAGDILEIGAFKGKSAVLLGLVLQQGESLSVCDLFGDPPPDPENREETVSYYPNLGRRDFEKNYRSFHAALPVVYQCSSDELPARLPADQRFRLVHVDGSHLYTAVRTDARTARARLDPGGVVVFDDFRAAHAPGVAAAVWEEVATGGLVPLWVTEAKFYGSWDVAGHPFVARMRQRAQEQRISSEVATVGGYRFLRFLPPPRPTPERLARALVPPVFHWARLSAKARLQNRRTT